MEERNTSDPSGHRRRLLELDKDALADEVHLLPGHTFVDDVVAWQEQLLLKI